MVQGSYIPAMMKFVLQSANPQTFQQDNLNFLNSNFLNSIISSAPGLILHFLFFTFSGIHSVFR